MKLFGFFFVLLLFCVVVTTKVIKLSSLKLKSGTCSSPSDITGPIQAGLELAAFFLDCVPPLTFFKCNPFTAAAGFTGLIGSILGINTDTVSTCQLDAKLDQIIQRLNEISFQLEDISLMIQCQQIKSDYEKVTLKLNNMMNLIYEYANNPSNQSKFYLRTALRTICIDSSEGLNNVLNSMFYLLNEGQIINNFKTCGQYKSNYIDQRAIQFQQMTFMFIFLVKGCEEAFEFESEFNKTDFINVVKDKIEYHRNYTAPKYFYDDKSTLGFNYILQQKVKEGKLANETQYFLQQNYGYLNWQVIYYPNNLAGYARHKWIGFRDNSIFGSKWYTGENQTNKNAIIAWSHPAAIRKNKEINFNFNWDCIAACWLLDDFVIANLRASTNLNYAFIASDASNINIERSGEFAYQEQSRPCGNIYYPTYLFASIYSPPLPKNSTFKNRAVVLPDKNAPITALKTNWNMASLKDSVSGFVLSGTNYSFVPDRLNRTTSAIYLKNTYLNAPPGVYFNNDFTVTSWIYLKSNTSAKIIDFSDSANTSYVEFSVLANYKLRVNISKSIVEISYNSSLLNSWHHLAFTLKSGKGLIYVDGIAKSSSINMNSPLNVNRNRNYIGKSSDNGTNIDAIIDELKFYSGGRTSFEIMDEYQFDRKK